MGARSLGRWVARLYWVAMCGATLGCAGIVDDCDLPSSRILGVSIFGDAWKGTVVTTGHCTQVSCAKPESPDLLLCVGTMTGAIGTVCTVTLTRDDGVVAERHSQLSTNTCGRLLETDIGFGPDDFTSKDGGNP